MVHLKEETTQKQVVIVGIYIAAMLADTHLELTHAASQCPLVIHIAI